ncbi:MAG TPA: CoA-binding protein [Bacteroidetes bacterium]|nr:CoA-binding protein [Bacteroidota bacterium]
MINRQLLDPKSIVVVGGSDDTAKPGGKVLKNLKDGNFGGELYVLNPKADEVQGVKSFRDPAALPSCDLAILAIAARHCPPVMEVLAGEKGVRAFIVLSAGFSEESEEGAGLERRMVEIVNGVDGCLIGPNCIGFLNPNYNGVFTEPIPRLDPKGCDFISGSGATAVFIMESGIPKGLSFASVYSVGNSAQMGVEDVLKYLDEVFDPEKSSRVKLLYMESVKKPQMLLKHASSLISKGCRIAAVKAGSSEAGSRAASSHTGAMASPDTAVDALFRKAGIVRCEGREELVTVASVMMHPVPRGKRMAIVTHAGGPAVMLTDALSREGFEIPPFEGPAAADLLEKLFPGSSVANPIDFLATGTAEQLDAILEACEHDFHAADAITVIFGSPGLFPVNAVYDVLDRRMKTCKKPIYAVLPSVINAREEIGRFLARGRINFPDEVLFAHALGKLMKQETNRYPRTRMPQVDVKAVRDVIGKAGNGYLMPEEVQQLLDAAGIDRAPERVAVSSREMKEACETIGFPLVMKVVGPVHKSDVGGVELNINQLAEAEETFHRLMGIPEATGVLIQPMLKGIELFAGAKREEGYGHLVMCGLGGIYVEVLKDVQVALSPVTEEEAAAMIGRLKGVALLQGVRGRSGIDTGKFATVISRLSVLLETAPEIYEMDINPLLGSEDRVVAVDARIRIEKEK